MGSGGNERIINIPTDFTHKFTACTQWLRSTLEIWCKRLFYGKYLPKIISPIFWRVCCSVKCVAVCVAVCSVLQCEVCCSVKCVAVWSSALSFGGSKKGWLAAQKKNLRKRALSSDKLSHTHTHTHGSSPPCRRQEYSDTYHMALLRILIPSALSSVVLQVLGYEALLWEKLANETIRALLSVARLISMAWLRLVGSLQL